MTIKQIDVQLEECNEILTEAEQHIRAFSEVVLGMQNRIEQLEEAKLQLN